MSEVEKPKKGLKEFPKGGPRGRKKINEAERNIRKTIRFNKSEFDLAVKNSKRVNLDFSEFVRKLVLNPKISLKQKNPESVIKTHAQILKIGTNINQMARSLNNQYEQHHFNNIAQKLDTILLELSSIYEEISK